MGFLDRFKGLLSTEETPTKEDPQREINRLVRELRKRVSEGRARFAASSRDLSRLDRHCKGLHTQVNRAITEAKRRLNQGDEAGARRCLQDKVRAQGLFEEMGHERDRQKAALVLLQGSLRELASRVKVVEVRREKLRTQVRRSRALEARNRAMEDGKLGGAESLLEDLSARLEVEEELLQAGSAGDSLERRFAELEASTEINLAQLDDLSGKKRGESKRRGTL